MPQIVAAAMAQAAVAAPAAAATTAAVLPTAAAGIGTAAAQTAAVEAAKQAAIQQGMQQAGQAGIQQAAQAATTEAAKQAGVEAAKQSAVEASKQGVAQGFQKMLPQAADDAASLAVQSGSDAARNQAIEAFKSAAANPNKGIELGKVAGDVTSIPSAAPATPLPPAGSTPNLEALKQSAIQSGSPQFSQAQIVGSGSPVPPQSQMLAEQAARIQPVTQGAPLGQSSAFRQIPVDEAIQNELRNTAARTGERFASEQAAEQLAADPLRQGIAKGVELVKKYPMETGMGLMSLGQYMNKPEEKEKGKYKSTVDMSGFERAEPSTTSFTPSYEHLGYAIGGPVEQMAAMNAVGANTGYPMAGINTPMYSNPMVQRPEAVNVISPSGDAGVTAYSGEPRFAEGGISDEMAKEYGLKTRKQRATKGLSQAYEDIEKERASQLSEAKSLSDRFDKGIVPRSRTQMLSSPYSAAIEEHNRLAKKTKTPQFQQPKTSLGDIDTYMDVPVELAASGGIMGGLGSYSDGGRLLRGPGDGVSDSIPAVIGKRQPARLADGEFVIPARIVSELGNGSTEAGARKLYAMMERIQNTRKKSIGKKKVAVNSRADKHLPA
jgi:hypothetical protein